MSVSSRVSSFLRNIFGARRVEQDLDDEVRAYLDMVIDENRDSGLAEDEARRAALVEMEGFEQVKEHVREARAGALAEALWRDVTYAVRVMQKHRGFTAAAVTTLALGIGANTAIFSIVDTIVFRPLPYADPGRLVKIWGATASASRADISWPDFHDIQTQNRVFDGVAADDGMGYTVVHNGVRETALGAMVTIEWLSTLGVRPILGRTFLRAEAEPGHDAVIILTHSYWRRRFASDPNVVGTVLEVDGRPSTIVGVLPPNVLRYVSDFLKPLVPADYSNDRGHRDLDVFARLRLNVTLAQAQTELDTIAARLEREYPITNTGRRLAIVPLEKAYVSINERTTRGLQLIAGAVAFVLLIACVNVVNLLLARGVTRSRECVIRTALGASRARLMRQLLIENLLLFLAGGVLGLFVARWSIDSLLAFAVASGYVPEQMVIAVDGRVFAFSLLVSTVAGIVFGAAPAFQLSRVDVNVGLRDSAPTFYGGRRRTRLRHALMVSELVLSTVLLIAFGLLIRSFLHVQSNGRSLPANTVLETAAEGGRSFASAVTFWRGIMESVLTVPGVTSVAVTSRPPVHGARQKHITIAGRPASATTDVVGDILVSADYFRTLDLGLVAGRTFTEQDGGSTPPVAIVSETLARRYFPHENPLGKRVMADEQDPMTCCAAAASVKGVWREIVGVVQDVRQANLDEPPAATLYRPYSQIVEHDMFLLVRTESAAAAARVTRDLRARLALVAPGTEWDDIQPLQQAIDGSESIRLRRFVLTLLGSFVILAVALAAVGLYGVMAYFVAERQREIGIRVALGASAPLVLRNVLVEALRLAVIALVLGAIAAQVLTRLIAAMLFGVTGNDMATYVAVWTFLAGVTLLASYLPARRAAHVDPIVALREP
jgi:putative ABC transport system permease protein